MKLKKNIKVGKTKIFILVFLFIFLLRNSQASNLEVINKKFIEIRILDKVSSKTSNLVLENGKKVKFKNLILKSLKCINSEFDDNPEVTAYLQVSDINNKKNDEVFIFNGWTFASSPSLRPFDHPVYDVWLLKCFN